MGEVVGWFWLVWDSRWAERTWCCEAFVYFFFILVPFEVFLLFLCFLFLDSNK
jgi:hypothetical protein